jgi:hypothetical protein
MIGAEGAIRWTHSSLPSLLWWSSSARWFSLLSSGPTRTVGRGGAEPRTQPTPARSMSGVRVGVRGCIWVGATALEESAAGATTAEAAGAAPLAEARCRGRLLTGLLTARKFERALGNGDDDQGDAEPGAISQLNEPCDGAGRGEACGVPLRRVRAAEGLGDFSLHPQGRPCGRRHDGHRGTGLTLPPRRSRSTPEDAGSAALGPRTTRDKQSAASRLSQYSISADVSELRVLVRDYPLPTVGGLSQMR